MKRDCRRDALCCQRRPSASPRSRAARAYLESTFSIWNTSLPNFQSSFVPKPVLLTSSYLRLSEPFKQPQPGHLYSSTHACTHTHARVRARTYTVRNVERGTDISEPSKRVPVFLCLPRSQASEFLFSTGELEQNLKAQTRPPGAVPEPWMISDVILTLPARISAQAPRFQSYRNDHSL